MGWQDLLEKKDEKIVFPWVGGRDVAIGARRWRLEGPFPEEEGWVRLTIQGRVAEVEGPVDPEPALLQQRVCGYLVGDYLVPDFGLAVRHWCPHCGSFLLGNEPSMRERNCGTCHSLTVPMERVHLLEPLNRFSRISAGRTSEDGPLIYRAQEMPLGPEAEAMVAFEDHTELNAKGVTPALHAAFALAVKQRADTERRRREAERRRHEEAERRAQEERRQAIVQRLGDAAGRREMARVDFAEAARAALAVGGAEYLDHRRAAHGDEFVVRFRFLRRRFECVVSERLQVVDSGICLTAHYDDPDFEGGTKGDTWLTLESLPSVIHEAEEAGRLVVYRHVN